MHTLMSSRLPCHCTLFCHDCWPISVPSRLFSSASKTNQGTISRYRSRGVKGGNPSSTAWLRRQLTDPYVKRAKEEGYPSRAAYKLIEMDEKEHLLQRGFVVLDLGAAPGGWSKVAVKKVQPNGMVVSVDIQEIEPIQGIVRLKGSIEDPTTHNRILEVLGSRKVNIMLSDMAPSASGHKDIDHVRLIELNLDALELARHVLGEGGAFLTKISHGAQEAVFKEAVLKNFKQVQYLKPKASRTESSEIYLLSRGFTSSREKG